MLNNPPINFRALSLEETRQVVQTKNKQKIKKGKNKSNIKKVEGYIYLNKSKTIAALAAGNIPLI